MQQKLGPYENIKVEWVPGLTPVAVLYNSKNEIVKQFELIDKDLESVLDDLRANGLEPRLKKAIYPDTPTSTDTFGGHHYHLYHVPSFFDEAKAFAESLSFENEKGYLVTITDKEEDEAVREFLKKSNVESVWMGAKDSETEGIWKWDGGSEKGVTFYISDGSLTNNYANWKQGEPNNADNAEHCGSVVTDGWNDAPCEVAQLSVLVEFGSASFKADKKVDL